MHETESSMHFSHIVLEGGNEFSVLLNLSDFEAFVEIMSFQESRTKCLRILD